MPRTAGPLIRADAVAKALERSAADVADRGLTGEEGVFAAGGDEKEETAMPEVLHPRLALLLSASARPLGEGEAITIR
jgi:hypothetical protein